MDTATTVIDVGVVGCGNLAQVIHLPNLMRLSDRFRVRALCDIDPRARQLVAAAYPGIPVHADVRDLVATPLDAVLIVTTGNHLTEITAAAEAGLAMFIEKPLCLTAEEAADAVETVERSGVVVSVGYMKRHSPGTLHAARTLPELGRLLSVTCELWHPPQDRYLAGHVVQTRPPGTGGFEDAMRSLVSSGPIGQALGDSLGAGATLEQRIANFLLTTVGIHDVNLLRAFLGEPVRTAADIWHDGFGGQARLTFPNDVPATFTWLYPPTGSHHEVLSFVGERGRLQLRYPPPYLPLAPVTVDWEREGPGGRLSSGSDVAGYEDPFKQELLAFHAAVTEGTPVTTTVEDAAADLALIRELTLAPAAVPVG